MKKLKIILNSKYTLITFLLIAILSILINENINNISKYDINNKEFICTINNVENKDKYTKYKLDCKETIYAYDYNNLDTLSIGDIVKINGDLKEYTNSTNNLFNYKNYYNKKGIYYKLTINKITKIDITDNIILLTKKYLTERINTYKSSKYMKALILGDTSDIESSIYDNYKYLGIIHLFSISGMHIDLLNNILEKIVNNKKNSNKIILIIIFLYYKIIGSISLLRTLILKIINILNISFRLELRTWEKIFYMISTVLIIKPNSIHEMGFWYSVIISSSILLFKSKKNKNNVIKIPLITFLFSLPLSIYYYSEINYLTIIYNIIFIPFISSIIYPLCLISLLVKPLDSLLIILICLLEKIINLLGNMDTSLIFIKPSIGIIIIYYLVIMLIMINKKMIVILSIIILIHYNYNQLIKTSYISVLDVGQGDSILMHLDSYNVLIDTGVNINNESKISNQITIPYLKQYGIKKIDYLITSHGDYDHMGEAINLVENFKVENVIFNCGEYNELEKELIKVLEKKKIKYYSCIKELNIDKYKLQLLNTKEYDNENDNSNVIYFNYNNYKFLFMGDAGIDKEKDILDKYNLNDIDFLKVGHHGSNTSSGKYFINKINPKYSLISVGKNNRYGHPKDEVLETLKNSKIYRTDLDGSIEIKLNKNGYKIRTCPP